MVSSKKKNESGNPRAAQPGGEDLTFTAIRKSDVPHLRKGKHHDLIAELIRDLQKVGRGAALKVPRTAFGEAKMTNVRAALNRVASRDGLSIATSSDDEHFYVWLTK